MLKIKKRYKLIATFLSVNLLFEALAPCALALTGGPTQPEFQSFAPASDEELVDLFTGDFKYNIALFDVEGYPLNINYNSGITMDQEASWVGLGWNLNTGAITRNMRGIPDDFNGDIIEKEYNIKPNRTYGLSTGGNIELFGFGKVGGSYGLRYNTYKGIAMEKSLSLSISVGESSKTGLTGGLGLSLTSSSDEGLSLQPSISLTKSMFRNIKDQETKSGLSIGSSFNSREGLKTLTIGASIARHQRVTPGYTRNNTLVGASAKFDLGTPTYIPQVTLPMRSFNITGSFKLGGEFFGGHGNLMIQGYYAAQSLRIKKITNPAYGYMYSDAGQQLDEAILDFNREKDGAFTPNTPALPVTNFTYDIYSVSGQGVEGSYKAFRSDMGYVFDPASSTSSDGYSIGLEVGAANAFHGGLDLSMTFVDTKSGNWQEDNDAASLLKFHNSTSDPLYEPYYLKEANEKTIESDPAFFSKAGGYAPQRIKLNQISKFNTIADGYFHQSGAINPNNYRNSRDIRNQSISVLTRKEAANFGTVPRNFSQTFAAPDHHISEVTVTKTNGERYVYGIPAYNTKYCEVTFATGDILFGGGGSVVDVKTGLVPYNDGDNSTGNKLGLDNYFSKTNLPPYAHSYLLTSVLSSDYIDGDEISGPSYNDLGSYTKFNYTKIDNYKWRTPFENLKASYSEGLKSIKYDDKANYVYGEKELWYLQSIETKNQIAIFHTEAREDGFGVIGENGGIETDTNKATRLLRKISLYSKQDYLKNGSNAVPLKEAHFVYDYSLCSGIPTNPDGGGKLTLKEIYITNQNSKKGQRHKYKFSYSDFNPGYEHKSYNRWGNYKPNNAISEDVFNDELSTSDYPYVEQDKPTADLYSQAWTLNSITEPSGKKIAITYESDDYAYVQNKRAMQMFKVVGIDRDGHGAGNATNIFKETNLNGEVISNDQPLKLIIKLQEPINTSNAKDIFYFNYLQNIQFLYFRFLMQIRGDRYEFVPGYIKEKVIVDYGVYDGGEYAWIAVKQVSANEHGGSMISQFTKAAIQFGQLQMPREVWDEAESALGSDESFGKNVISSIINSDPAKNIMDAILGPNQALYLKGVGHHAVMNKSWIRLWNPDHKKLGGGLRVKKIEIKDNWGNMTASAEPSHQYGYEYEYTNEDGTSSGVAAYEPLIGGDENPFKTPVFFNEKVLLAPDYESYMEEPFGESFFPSPVVGYSRVVVKNVQKRNLRRHASGKVIHEFYTLKDFPIITQRTSVDSKREKSKPFGLAALFNLDVKDYMTASQGYVVELNDMHGKPKSQKVLQQNEELVSSLEYRYQTNTAKNQVENKVSVIKSNGSIENNVTTGEYFDFVADMREHKTTTMGGALQGNIDGFFVVIIPIIVPIGLPSLTYERTRFRSAVVTKVIQRFGTLDETIATDLGSVVSTKNIAYDAESGEVLLTKTTTNFNDSVFTLKFPAYWYYENMGPAYQNIGLKTRLEFSTNGGKAAFSNAHKYFAEGDEISLSENEKAWVSKVTTSDVSAILKNGSVIVAPQDVKIYRSGKRNQQQVNMATITTLKNPLNNIKDNIYENVLQADAIEFTNNWRTYCDCIPNEILENFYNPFVSGTKGYWKPKQTFMYHTDRTQAQVNNNTDIRHDGLFSSFNPFYKLSGNKWLKDEKNWVFTAEATEFSPFGQQLESRDALDRYSSDVFGYNHNLQLLKAANAKYIEVGADNFEDYYFSDCADDHFKFKCTTCPKPTNAVSHTGQYSMKIRGGAPLVMQKSLVACELRDCSLTITEKSDSNLVTLTMSGGVPPYMVDWEIINGSPVVNIDDTGKIITINSGGNYEVEITAVDAYGCKKIKTVVK